MKKTILFIMLIAGCFISSKAQVAIPYQELSYNVKYQWGIIDVMIARGRVTMESDGRQFSGTLNGTSIPWEGKIINVADTLRANIGDNTEIVTYQSGWYRHTPVSLFRGGSYNADNPAYYRNIAGQGDYSASSDSMEAITITSDMIGMYYYSHVIDFEKLQPGEVVTLNIDGPYSRRLDITYQGKGVTDVNGDSYPTYNCSFIYSYAGGRNYPVECKISASDRIPVYLSASLPVGHVEMMYDPD